MGWAEKPTCFKFVLVSKYFSSAGLVSSQYGSCRRVNTGPQSQATATSVEVDMTNSVNTLCLI